MIWKQLKTHLIIDQAHRIIAASYCLFLHFIVDAAIPFFIDRNIKVILVWKQEDITLHSAVQVNLFEIRVKVNVDLSCSKM